MDYLIADPNLIKKNEEKLYQRKFYICLIFGMLILDLPIFQK